MKIKLLIIILLLISINTGLIKALQDGFNMGLIIEIDNVLSKDKARNTSNPNVKEVEQNNPIYFHYIKNCGITDIDDKDSGIQKARYEFYTHNDFKKNRNTLLFIPLVERDFPVEFNCTEEILTIKSISPSKFNEIKPVTIEGITTTNGNNNNSNISSGTNPTEDKPITKDRNDSGNDDKPNLKNIGEIVELILFFISLPIIVHTFVVKILNSGKGGKNYRYLHTIIGDIWKKHLKFKKIPKKENN